MEAHVQSVDVARLRERRRVEIEVSPGAAPSCTTDPVTPYERDARRTVEEDQRSPVSCAVTLVHELNAVVRQDAPDLRRAHVQRLTRRARVTFKERIQVTQTAPCVKSFLGLFHGIFPLRRLRVSLGFTEVVTRGY